MLTELGIDPNRMRVCHAVALANKLDAFRAMDIGVQCTRALTLRHIFRVSDKAPVPHRWKIWRNPRH